MSSLVKELHSGQFGRKHACECLNRSPNRSTKQGGTLGNFCPLNRFSVDDGGDEDEANLRNGGDRGECAERGPERLHTLFSREMNLSSALHQ